jgi:glycosyltransferase involved in cell wall biosynthesis
MKKIVIIAPKSVHVTRFLNGLDAHNIEYYVITNYELHSITKDRVCRIKFSLFNIKSIKKIRNFLLQIKPDILHIHQANSVAFNTIIALKLTILKPKVILTTWGSDILVLPHKGYFLRWMVKFNLGNSDVITADAKYVLSKIQDLLPDDNPKVLHLINFGVAVSTFNPELLTQKEDLILSVRLHKDLYNIDKIILGFISAVKSGVLPVSYNLVVAASGENTDKLKLLAQSSICDKRIKFVGMLDYDELVGYYRKAKIMISIPESDASASSLFEAMMYGCIPLVSDLPANKEWITDEVNGVVARADNLYLGLSQDLARAIHLTQDIEHYQQIYHNNYETILELANHEASINKFIDLYQ